MLPASRAPLNVARPTVAPRRAVRGAVVAATVALLAACGGSAPAPVLHEGLHTVSAEIAVGDAIAAENGYARGAVEVMVSRAQLRVLVSDAGLAEADAARHAAAAAGFVATAEKALASDREFPAIEVISVAIVHPPQLREGRLSSHTEEVFEFRKGPDLHFAPRGH
jgi:hypothetical protein